MSTLLHYYRSVDYGDPPLPVNRHRRNFFHGGKFF
jgi:hypothetical protein